jgi:pectate lyase
MKRIFFLAGFVVVLLFCFTSDTLAADGFGQYATGGAGGAIVTVTTAADFNTYVKSTSPYIIQVSGTINLTPIGYKVYITSNKTIRGINSSSKIIGNLAFQQYANNVIIERLTITNPTIGEDHSDGISVKENVTNAFITHCSFYDCGDGCLDTTEESDNVTVSWCKFYYVSQSAHNNVCLVGHVDTNYDDRGKLHVTFHHNWWSTKCMERMPRVRFGRAHVYNNYYSCTNNTYCVGVGVECQIRLENNYFDSVKETWRNWSSAGIQGLIGWNTGATGNQFVGTTTIPTWAPNDYNNIFTPSSSYSYTMDDGPNVKSIVMAGAGITGGDANAPAAPTGLEAMAGDATVSLNWNNNGEGDLAGYYVYRSTNSGPPYSRLNSTPLTSSDYTDNTVTNGINYYYVVTAIDTSLNESVYSSEVSATAAAGDIPPAAPAGLTVTPGEANVPLDWNDNSEIDLAGYNVYRSETSGSGYSKLNYSLLDASNYVDNITTHNTTYYYVVTAVDTNLNESGYSSEVFGGLYGDFTGNGLVEIADLADFLDLWLESDCGLTAGIDLDDNCIVNFYEFSVLAENWLKKD